MGRLSNDRIDELQQIANEDGVLACLKEAGDHAEGIMVCEGLNYDYYVGEARAIEMELQKGFVDLNYMDEKIRHLKNFSDIVDRRRRGESTIW